MSEVDYTEWKTWSAGATPDHRAQHRTCGAKKAFGTDDGARARWIRDHVCEAAS